MSKFKKGDRVRVTKREDYVFFDVGTVGVIQSINPNDRLSHEVQAGNNGRQWCSEEQLELVEDKTTTKKPKRPFKVGDKVRIIKMRDAMYGLTPCSLDSTVYEIVEDDASVLPYKCVAGAIRHWCTAGQLELVTEKSPAQSTAKRTFKVGDKVRVIDHTPESTAKCLWVDNMEPCLGKVGVVIDVTGVGTVRVRFDNDWWHFDPAWLTPVIDIDEGTSRITQAWSKLCEALGNTNKEKTNIKTKLINDTKLLTNLKLN